MKVKITAQLMQIILTIQILTMEANINQYEMEEEEQSFHIVPLIQKKSTKRIERGQPLVQRLESLRHQLIDKIYVVTPVQFRSLDFRKQLKNFRYEKRQKTKTTVQPIAHQEKYLQQHFFTFKDAFTDFKIDTKRKFYIITSESKSVLYFFHLQYEEQMKINGKNKNQTDDNINKTYLFISSRDSYYTQKLKQFQIPYESLQINQNQVERLIIKGRSINAFYTLFVNMAFQQNIVMQIVANFYFLNSIQVLPVQLYNGVEKRDIYEHIGEQKMNILNQKKKQIYGLRMQGLWFSQNIQSIFDKLKGDNSIQNFDMQFQVQKYSSYISGSIQSMLSKTYFTPKKSKTQSK